MPLLSENIGKSNDSKGQQKLISPEELLWGKTIVIVSPGYPGKRFVFEKAHELGVNTIVIDSPGSWTQDLQREGIVSQVIEVDMSLPEEAIFEECVKGLSQYSSIDGICTYVELSSPLTAKLCEYFGVCGHSSASVALARDKHQTRKAVVSNPTTNQYAIRTFLLTCGTNEELQRAAAHVGFPAVLKPVSGAASLGVQKVLNCEELVETYHEISQLLKDLIVTNGALERKVRMEQDDAQEGAKKTSVGTLSNTSIIMEEYLSGQEVDIDMVIQNGRISFCEVSDNGPTVEPYYGETFNWCPSLLPSAEQDQLVLMAHQITCEALGFKNGVFHVEAKMTPNGPRLIEVNCRMGGGPIRAIHLLRSNVDLVTEQLLLAVGLPTSTPIMDAERLCIGFINVNARKSGSVGTLNFLTPFETMEGMVYCRPCVSVGEHIIGPEEGQPSWLAEAVFIRKTAIQAQHDAIAIYGSIQDVFESYYV